MKAVLFDLDGTLLDTLRDIADACNAALRQHGLSQHPLESYRYFVGDGVRELIRRVAPKEYQDEWTLKSLVATYRDEYQRNWNATTRPYPGIPELLDRLAADGTAIAVLSNKPDDFTRRCVARFLGAWSFNLVLGATELFPPKPDPLSALHIAKTLNLPPADFIYLGDTATDMKTAVAAGMFPTGVLWGFRTASELKDAGAARLLEQPTDLFQLL